MKAQTIQLIADKRRRELLRRSLFALASLSALGCSSEEEPVTVLGRNPAGNPAPAPAPAPTPGSPPSAPPPPGSPPSAPPPASSPPPPGPAPAPAPSTTWNPQVPALLVGSNATFDLASTLPTTVARGGRFGLDSMSAALPAGMSLSAAGILAVGNAAISSVAGVIFTYELP